MASVVYHLVGSPTSKFYFDLSVMYAQNCVACEDLDREKFVHRIALVHLGGQWSFPADLSSKGIASAPKLSMAEALVQLEQEKVDVCLPHMFCQEGYVRYRALIEMLKVELLGCSAECCGLTVDKYLTKQTLVAAHVKCPGAELLLRDHCPDVQATAEHLVATRPLPFIVKPCREDNSLGVALCRQAADVAPALTTAFGLDAKVICEEYIPGRECRVAVLELDGELQVLPKIEYLLDDIRTREHKLQMTGGNLDASDADPQAAILAAKKEGDRVCPAQFPAAVDAELDRAAIAAHKAIGAQYYSLYDVRIDPEGNCFFLEAANFCSVAPLSVISTLAAKQGMPHPELFERLLAYAAEQTRKRRDADSTAVSTASETGSNP
jgi:D-alanine-D-alanine ligase